MLQGLPALQRPACIHLPQGHRLRAWKPLQSQTCARQPVKQRRSRCVVHAAAAGLPSDDPIQVLKLPQNPDSQAIQRQYNKLKRENKGNEAALTRIENAHSALMMRGLSARLKGGVEVAKEVRYADKAQYLPWRPRVHRADQKLLLYHGIAQALLAGWALLLSVTAGTQPVVASAVAGGVANVWKLNQIFPAPTSSSASEDEKNRGLKNILRGCLLGFLATFFGCFLFFTLPDLVASKINRQLPYWFYANEKVLLCLGTTLSNFFMTGFFR